MSLRIRSEMSALSHILILAKQPQLSVSYFIQGEATKLAILMKEVHRWIGWSKKKNEELPLFLQQPQPFGKECASISLILRAMLILRLKLSALFVFLMEESLSLMLKKAYNLNQKQCGDKQTNIKYRD